MSAAEFLRELTKMPAGERETVFASLVENPDWREDLLDLITLSERRDEPTRPIEAVFKDLKIDA
jgi:hypothetical protein